MSHYHLLLYDQWIFYRQNLSTIENPPRRSPSPYIFILCSEILYGLWNKAQDDSSLPRIHVETKNLQVDNFLFANNMMLLCKSDKNFLETFKIILRQYELASGLLIYRQKSRIIFPEKKKTPWETRERWVNRDLDISNIGGVGKYLGFFNISIEEKKGLFTLNINHMWQRAIRAAP